MAGIIKKKNNTCLFHHKIQNVNDSQTKNKHYGTLQGKVIMYSGCPSVRSSIYSVIYSARVDKLLLTNTNVSLLLPALFQHVLFVGGDVDGIPE